MEKHSRCYSLTADRDNSVDTVTRYGLDDRGSNPGGSEIFRTCPDPPWVTLSFMLNGYRVSFTELRRPECGLNHSPDSRTEVKERVDICLYFPSGALMACNTAKLKISYVINFQYLLAPLDSVVCRAYLCTINTLT